MKTRNEVITTFGDDEFHSACLKTCEYGMGEEPKEWHGSTWIEVCPNGPPAIGVWVDVGVSVNLSSLKALRLALDEHIALREATESALVQNAEVTGVPALSARPVD